MLHGGLTLKDREGTGPARKPDVSECTMSRKVALEWKNSMEKGPLGGMGT